MISRAKTVKEYLAGLPADRKEAIAAIREIILKNLPNGYEETMLYRMISYIVPLKLYPQGYLGKKDVPLCYVTLTSQKNHFAVYLTNIYGDKKAEQWFKNEYKKSGKKLDMGKSCVRFRKLADVPLELIGQAIARTSVTEFIKIYEAARSVKK